MRRPDLGEILNERRLSRKWGDEEREEILLGVRYNFYQSQQQRGKELEGRVGKKGNASSCSATKKGGRPSLFVFPGGSAVLVDHG